MSVVEQATARYRGWKLSDVLGEVDVTWRQLDYWRRIDLVTPSIRDAVGSGNWCVWSDDDVSVVHLVSVLVGEGGFAPNMEVVRRAVRLYRLWLGLPGRREGAFMLVGAEHPPEIVATEDIGRVLAGYPPRAVAVVNLDRLLRPVANH